TEEPTSAQVGAEPLSRQARPADSPGGFAAELSRPPSTATPSPPRAARERETAREPMPLRTPPQPPSAPPEAPFTAAADHNLADMAQRLEAALRRPAKPDALTDSRIQAPPAPTPRTPPPPPI